MKIVAIIPSRYASSRFPGKPLALIAGKPMIQWVFENVSEIDELDAVYVATDDKRILECVKAFGGKVLMTSDTHTCGTDRLAECVELLNLDKEDIVLNIQGDEPLIKKETVLDLINMFQDSDVYMGTLKKKIEKEEDINDPNIVKVITDIKNNAVYFSRFAIPYNRNVVENVYYKRIR